MSTELSTLYCNVFTSITFPFKVLFVNFDNFTVTHDVSGVSYGHVSSDLSTPADDGASTELHASQNESTPWSWNHQQHDYEAWNDFRCDFRLNEEHAFRRGLLTTKRTAWKGFLRRKINASYLKTVVSIPYYALGTSCLWQSVCTSTGKS